MFGAICVIWAYIELTLHVLQYQNPRKIWTAHSGYNSSTKEARKQDLRNEVQRDFQPAPSPSNDQFWKHVTINCMYISRYYDVRIYIYIYIYRKIWSSLRYCFRHLVSSLDDSKSRPNGFSTITLVQPFTEEALLLAHLATSTNMFGGIDK